MTRYLFMAIFVAVMLTVGVIGGMEFFSPNQVAYSSETSTQNGLAVSAGPGSQSSSAEAQNTSRSARTGQTGARTPQHNSEQNNDRADTRQQPKQTVTERFKNFVATLELSGAGSDLEKKEKQELVLAFLQQSDIRQKVKFRSPHTPDELNLVSDNSEASLRRYTNELAEIFFTRVPDNARDEMEVFRNAVSADGPRVRGQHIRQLENIRNNYLVLRHDLAEMRVPTEVADIHVAILNGLANVADRVNGMMQLNQDPFEAALHAMSYKRQVGLLRSAYDNLATTIREKGIDFSTDARGAVFLENATMQES